MGDFNSRIGNLESTVENNGKFYNFKRNASDHLPGGESYIPGKQGTLSVNAAGMETEAVRTEKQNPRVIRCYQLAVCLLTASSITFLVLFVVAVSNPQSYELDLGYLPFDRKFTSIPTNYTGKEDPEWGANLTNQSLLDPPTPDWLASGALFSAQSALVAAGKVNRVVRIGSRPLAYSCPTAATCVQEKWRHMIVGIRYLPERLQDREVVWWEFGPAHGIQKWYCNADAGYISEWSGEQLPDGQSYIIEAIGSTPKTSPEIRAWNSRYDTNYNFFSNNCQDYAVNLLTFMGIRNAQAIVCQHLSDANGW